MRIHELGKELGVDNKLIVDFLQKEGVKVNSQLNAVPEKMIDKVRANFSNTTTKEKEPAASEIKAVAVPDFIVKKSDEKEKEEAKRKEEAKAKQEKADTSADENGAPKKKKIVAVFNPQNSETSQGRAAAEQRAKNQQNTEKKEPAKAPAKRIPARDRRPSDEQPVVKPPKKLPSQIRPARERMSDDEIEALKKAEAEKAAAAEAAKAPAEAKTTTPPPAAKKPEVKTIASATAASTEPEAVKSLRDKIVKGTVNITDIPVKPAKSEKGNNNNNYRNNRNNNDRNNNDRGGRDGNRNNRDFNNRRDNNGNNDRNNNNRDNRDNNRDNRNNNRDNRDNRDNRNNNSKPAAAGFAPAQNDRRDNNRGKGKYNKYDKSQGDKFDRNENEKAAQRTVKQPVKPEPVEEEIKVITLPDTISIKDFAAKLKMQPAALIKTLFLKGKVYTVNDILDYETAEEIALEFDIISEHEVVIDYIEELLAEEEEAPETQKKRPPVVCVMGHVDHGKTSLLDAIRKTNVISGEAGGITQHIGAYTVEINGESITFLDTPGHEAFTAMRLRGAQATDVAILVVAADDGVMPQTIEAINHAKAANIQVIVAVNKIDKPGANIPRVMQELSDQGLVPEDWGGETIFVPISAKTGEGIENLLEMVILGTEILELKANPDRMARGIVIEAKLDKGRGSVATLLVQKGTLKVGDHIAMGEAYGKVRSMTDDKGQRVKSAGPSTPVEITGLSGVPNAGEVFVAFKNDKEAKHFAQVYIEENKKKLLAGTKAKMSLDDVFGQMKAGELKELKIVIKADVQGSAEAMKESLEKLSNDEVIVKVIHSGVGNVSESDAVLASASNAIIIAFNTGINADARATIDREKVDLRNYRVIYNAIDDVELAMKGMLEPIYEEVITGHVEVRQTFKASGVGIIAGSYILDGVVKRDSKVRVYRGEELIHEGQIGSLKRFNDDAKEVKSGYECGIVLADYTDIKEGDTMEAYEMKEVPRV